MSEILDIVISAMIFLVSFQNSRLVSRTNRPRLYWLSIGTMVLAAIVVIYDLTRIALGGAA